VQCRRGGRRRPPPWSAAAWALGAALLLAPACGLKTPPRPLSEVLPPPTGVRAWQRESALVVSWLLPDSKAQEKFGGVRGFELELSERPRLCPQCPASAPRELALSNDSTALQRQGTRLLHALPLAETAGRVSVRVRTRFGLGLGPYAAPAVVERAGPIPAPTLSWRWSGGGQGGAPVGGARSVQFFWEPPQESIAPLPGQEGPLRARPQTYRANLYRRVPPAPWPPLPLNPAPLEEATWTVPPLQAEFPPEATGEAYLLRYVDRFGNEGAASPEVLIPLAGRRP
jgi:hypothetical protein